VQLLAHRSTAIDLKIANGEAVVSSQLNVSVGRVAVTTLSTSDTSGIRSVLGTASTATGTILPATGDAGQSILAVADPASGQVRFGATLLSSGSRQTAGGLAQTVLAAGSAKPYPVVTDGPSGLQVQTTPASPGLVAVRRVQGKGSDVGATAGAAPASSWIVTPTVAGSPNVPGMVLVNPGIDPIEVTLRLLPVAGESPAQPTTTVTVLPASAIGVPAAFLQQVPDAAVSATTSTGSFVPAGASSSLGALGTADYAIAVGIPIPRS
jgi:hypothetical protein